MSELRPPLASPRSHEGIEFVFGEIRSDERLAPAIVAAIGAALYELLPPGDFLATPEGLVSGSCREDGSLWMRAGRLDGLRNG
jgi:hypothetical protein